MILAGFGSVRQHTRHKCALYSFLKDKWDQSKYISDLHIHCIILDIRNQRCIIHMDTVHSQNTNCSKIFEVRSNLNSFRTMFLNHVF